MEQSKSLQKYALIVIIATSFLTSFLSGALNIAIPYIGEEFKSGAVPLGWVATGFMLGCAVFMVPAGRLADIIGRKKVFLTGSCICFIAACLCGTVNTITALIVFQILQGVGAAMIFGPSQAIISSVIPPQNRGRALGANATGVYAGFSLGPVLGGIINHRFGWHLIFYICGGIGFLITLVGFLKLKVEWADAAQEKYDWAGSILYMLGFAAFMYAISTFATSSAAIYILFVGIVLLAVFIRYEIKAEYPVLNLKLFSRNRTFTFTNIAFFLNYCSLAGLNFFLSVYLQVMRGYDSQIAGIILISQPITIVIMASAMGKLSDRLNPRALASFGCGLSTLGIGILCFLSLETPLWIIIVSMLIIGAGISMFVTPTTNATMGSIEKRYYGLASSVLGTMRLTGQAVSLTIVTLIINLYAGNVELNIAETSRLISGGKVACVVFTIIGLGSVSASLVRNKRGVQPPQ